MNNQDKLNELLRKQSKMTERRHNGNIAGGFVAVYVLFIVVSKVTGWQLMDGFEQGIWLALIGVGVFISRPSSDDMSYLDRHVSILKELVRDEKATCEGG